MFLKKLQAYPAVKDYGKQNFQNTLVMLVLKVKAFVFTNQQMVLKDI